MALLTMALLTVALLTVALLTMAGGGALEPAILAMAQLGLFLHGSSYMALLTMGVLTVALLTVALLTMAGGGTRALGRREWYGAAGKVKLN